MTDAQNPLEPADRTDPETADVVDDLATADGGTDAGAVAPAGEVASEVAEADAGAVAGVPPHYGVGPFSIREVALLGVWLVAFIVSFFSVFADTRFGEALGLGESVWSSGLDWILTIGVPTAAVFLIVLRRFSPDGIRRVGSLGIDQFASVAFSVSTVVWLGILWNNIARAAAGGLWLNSWVVWVEFFVMLVGVFLTTLAPFIAPFDADFQHRPETVAHRAARPARPVVARPATVRPASQTADASAFAPQSGSGYAPQGATGFGGAAFGAQGTWAQDQAASPAANGPTSASDDSTPTTVIGAAATHTAPASQAFWALAPVERDVVDENGVPIFRIGPTAWALVIEDRGDTFVVRHEDGRLGYLTDTSGVTRG